MLHFCLKTFEIFYFFIEFCWEFSPFCKIIEMSIRATTPSWCIKPYCNETVNLLSSYIANKKCSIQANMWYWRDGNDKNEVDLCKTNLFSLVHDTPTRLLWWLKMNRKTFLRNRTDVHRTQTPISTVETRVWQNHRDDRRIHLPIGKSQTWRHCWYWERKYHYQIAANTGKHWMNEFVEPQRSPF